MNRKGQITGVFAGELDEAHRAAAKFAYDLFAVSISEQADLVIGSAGNMLNFVQSHKALFNAYQAVKPDGRMVLLCRCPEGLDGEQYLKWLRLGDRDAIIAGLRKQCEINGQTALSTLQKTPITFLVTELSEDQVALLGARKTRNVAEALALAREELQVDGRQEPTYYVMPSAAYTVPFLRGKPGDETAALEQEIKHIQETPASV
jgi:nickel-dependent lactate racemase